MKQMKKGDKLYCIKTHINYDATIEFNKNNTYTVYYINKDYIFIFSTKDNITNRCMGFLKRTINEYFLTPTQYRKLKLNTIEERYHDIQ